MVRHQQPVGLEAHPRQQACLLRGFNVPRQQRAALRARNAQHTRHGVGLGSLRVILRARVQDLKAVGAVSEWDSLHAMAAQLATSVAR